MGAQVSRPNVSRDWADRIRTVDRRVLLNQFNHEAAELHRLLSHEGRDVPAAWPDFRAFMADGGPSPGRRFTLQRKRRGGGPYVAGEVEWRRPVADAAQISPPLPAQPRTTYSQWTMIAGMPVQMSDVPARLGLSFGALSQAVSSGHSLDEIAARADEAEAALEDLSWLSPQPSHQQAFRGAYIAWRLKVQARYRAAAPPQFLYLHTLVPTMARSKAAVADAGLWVSLTAAETSARDRHPAWKVFNELLPKAAAVLPGFQVYAQYSLTRDIEELSARIEAAERRFRGA